MKSVKKLLRNCYGRRDRNYGVIAPLSMSGSGKRRRSSSQSHGGEIRLLRSRAHGAGQWQWHKCRTRCVTSLLLFGICALTMVLIFYTGGYILQKSEPLVITEYSGNARDFQPTTEVLEIQENSDPTTTAPTSTSTSTTRNQTETTTPVIKGEESPLARFRIEDEVVDFPEDEFQLPEVPSLQGEPHAHTATGDGIGCQLPRLDPFDDSILEFLELPRPPPIDCTFKYRRPILFSTDFGSNLITLEDPEEYGIRDCCYAPFGRVDEETIKVSDDCFPINNAKITPISPEHEFIIVYCYGGLGNSTRMRQIDMLNFVHEKSERLTLSPHKALYSKLKPKEDQLNVAMIGIDAVSHMNFVRTMPRSYSHLKNVSAIGMRGYTKVGDNTFPNVVPILTGLSVKELEGEEAGCWTDGGYFDRCPFIWKNFSRAGYVTSYAEDEEWMAAFNYEKYGFQDPPTDYYLRPFMSTLGDQMGHVSTGNAKLCYGPRLGFRVLLEYVAKLAVTMARPSVDRKYFAFTWSNSLSHDDLATPNHGDEDLVSLLRWVHSSGANEAETQAQADTILILLSDHGIRWGDIRTTLQGRIEERMPFLYFVFPEWFKTKYAGAIKNMESNQERLTTPFDLHETLLDLVDPAKYISDGALATHRHAHVNGKLPRGISLFAPIPPERTCPDASIEGHWCICHSMQTIPNPETDDRVGNATEAVLSTLNAMLEKYPQCSQLTLTAILNAQELVHPVLENLDEMETGTTGSPLIDTEKGDYDSEEEDEESETEEPSLPDSASGGVNKLTVTFKVAPSEAVFEASVLEEGPGPGDWTLSGDVSRVNLYGNQSRCVDEYTLKKYCYCP